MCFLNVIRNKYIYLANRNIHIILQVRPNGDAVYSSSIEPWSEWLTGTQGVAPNPSWDPLQYIIDEASPHGIQIHAWFNPYRANVRPYTSGLHSSNMCLKFPSYCYRYEYSCRSSPILCPIKSISLSLMLISLTKYIYAILLHHQGLEKYISGHMYRNRWLIK